LSKVENKKSENFDQQNTIASNSEIVITPIVNKSQQTPTKYLKKIAATQKDSSGDLIQEQFIVLNSIKKPVFNVKKPTVFADGTEFDNKIQVKKNNKIIKQFILISSILISD
jgi:hypothetical protein